MAVSNPMTTTESLPPSYFAAKGSPACSMWGKSEIEWLAHDYVRALAANGDSWEPLTREQCDALLPRNLRTSPYQMFEGDHYKLWFYMVSAQLTSAEGAAKVWNVHPGTLLRLMGMRA